MKYEPALRYTTVPLHRTHYTTLWSEQTLFYYLQACQITRSYPSKPDMSGNPPPPPPTPQNPRDKISPSVQKLRSVPPDHYIQASKPPAHVDIDPPTGPYFFYGTLMDPSILSAVLDLDPAAAEQRKADFDLRPAYIVGYECKLWGQYPALVDGPGFSSIEGAVFQVRTVQEGKRLAE